MEPELVLTLLKIAGVFVGLSFIVFWVGLVWWVSQDVTSRTNDKIILAAAVAFATIFGPVGVLLYLIVRPRQTIKESYREMLETEINRKLASMDMAYCPFCGANLERDAHVAHPDQLVMTEIEEQVVYDPQIAEQAMVGRSKTKLPQTRKVVDGGKLLSVRVSRSVVSMTKATAKGLTFLLTPLPAQERTDASDERLSTGDGRRATGDEVKTKTTGDEVKTKNTGDGVDVVVEENGGGGKQVEFAQKSRPVTKKKAASKSASRSGARRGKK